MRFFLVSLLFFLSVFGGFGQSKQGAGADDQIEILIKKQMICDSVQRQADEITFTVVRNFVRYKLAAWLWKDGKDDTGQAEPIAVSALNDLYEKRAEVPEENFTELTSGLLSLLDRARQEFRK